VNVVAFDISDPEQARTLTAKRADQPTDIAATKNMVTNTPSTSMNMTVIPSRTLGLRL
jgi:hypothetical protein